MFRATLLFVVVMALSPCSSVEGQTAKEVIDRYVEVIGGEEALEAIQTLREERVLVHLDEDQIIRTTTYRKRPHLYRSESTRPSGLIVNDGHAWRARYDAEGGVEWSESELPRGTDFEARLGWFIDWEEKGYQVVFVGTEMIDGVRMHHLRMTWRDGGTRELFFEVSTGLFTMFKPTSWGTVRVHDYRPIGGVLFPHLTEARGTHPEGREIHHLNMLVSLKVNLPVSDSMFIQPGSHDRPIR